jgi:hypothetical protein
MGRIMDYQAITESLLDSDSNISSFVIIEQEVKIVYSTGSWEITNDISNINNVWQKMKEERIRIAGIEYLILQITQERLVATNVNKGGSVVGIKDDERKILCKIAPKGQIADGLIDAIKILQKLSSKEPYLEPDASLGKVDEFKWATPRILLDDTNNLQELGLLKFGLSIEEAQVYLGLLRKGKEGETVGNLNEEIDIKRTTIYRILDRLIDKEWVIKLPGVTKGAQIFIARPLSSILDERIQQREEELKILKSFRFIMGEASENGWIDFSEIDKDSKSLLKKGYNFKTLGITGEEKDCGLFIFKYFSPIENDVIIKAALQLSCERLKLSTQVDEDIEEFSNPDLIDLKFENTKIRDYYGVIMYVKFKKGSKTAKIIEDDWIIAAKLVAIPVEDKINVIWGSEEKFPILMNMILQLY